MKLESSILFLTLALSLNFVVVSAVDNGGVWQPAYDVATSVTGDDINPQVAFDCDGNAICVWYNNQTQDAIYSARYNASAGSWETPESISTTVTGENHDPKIAIDCNGNAICVWYNNTTGNPGIYTARYNAAAGSWQAPENISTGITGDIMTIQVAVDCNGNAICVWYNDAAPDKVYAARYNAATRSWQAPESISTITVDSRNPQVAFDCNGNAIATWNTIRIYSARYNAAAGSWQTPLNIEVSGGRQPQITFDCNGNAICVWHTLGTGPIQTARYNAATGIWQSTETISPSVAGTNRLPQIAIDCNGNAMCVWYNTRDDGTIYAAYFDAVPAPSNIQIEQKLHRFTTQGDLVNVLSWDAVTFQNSIAKYKIKCSPYVEQTACCENCCDCKIRCCVCPCTNATLIGEVSASCPLVFRHHNRCYGQRTTYCLTAVDNQGNETPVPSSVTIPAV